MSEEETLLEFPCDFSVKAMGKAEPDFEAHVVALVRAHVPQNVNITARTAASKKGNYYSVSATFQAESKLQLDRIYQTLTDDKRVLMSL